MSIILRKGLILTSDYNNLENKPAIDGVELTKDTTKGDLGLDTVFIYKGQVETVDDLPTSGNVIGDTYNVKATGENYCWNGEDWDCLSGSTTVYYNDNTLQSGGSEISIDADKNTISNIETDNFKSGVIQKTLRATASAKDTSVATEKAVRTALDAGIKSVTDVIDTYGDIVTHNVSEFATAEQGAKADTAVQNLSDLGITATATELNYCDGVTSNIQTQLNNKQPTISNLSTIESNAAAGKSASDTIATYGDIVTHDADEFQPTGNYATAAQGAKADSALQPTDLSATSPIAYSSSTKKISVASGYQIPSTTDVGTWNNKQEQLISGTNIKTVNSESLLGSGNLKIKSFAPFPEDFVTEDSFEAFVISIENSSGAGTGLAYFGGIAGNWMPWGSGNAECKVEYVADDIALLTVSSSDIAPYHWEYNTMSGNFKWKYNILQTTTMDIDAYVDNIIVQYVGETDDDYTNGYFYRSENHGWYQLNVQPGLSFTPENVSNKVTSISSSSTDIQYPSAKCIYDLVGNLESLLHTINSGS